MSKTAAEAVQRMRSDLLIAIDRRENDALEELTSKTHLSEAIRDFERQHITSKFEWERQFINEEWRLVLRMTERELSLTREGDPEDVLETVDTSAVVKAELTAPNSYSRSARLEVEFSRQEGCFLRVRGDDPEWVRATFGALATEIGRCAPWWSWLRHWAAASLYGAVLVASVTLATLGEIPFRTDSGLDLLALLTLSPFWGTLLGLGVAQCARFLLPAFELVATGTRGRGRTVLGIVGGLVASLVLGVIVNKIS